MCHAAVIIITVSDQTNEHSWQLERKKQKKIDVLRNVTG